MRVSQWFEEMRDDVTYAFRQLRAAPVFTVIAVTTLALGIGANSAIFALVDATLLRPLPYANPDRLVTIWETSGTNPRSFASPPNMLDWNTRSRTFEKIAGFTPNVGGMVMAGRDGNAETVSRQWVTAGIFDVFGVKPIAGRTFIPEDEEQRRRVMVMSESLWESRFDRDPAIVGRDIKMDGLLFTVVGVVPKTFEILGRTSVWAMRPLVNMPPRARGQYMLQVVGRMKPGTAIGAAQSDLSAVAGGLASEFPQTNTGRGVRLEPLHDSMIGSDLKVTSMLFLGVVGFVLLICCANVANLLLARASARTRELAVRAALGAGRRRLIRQLLTESLVLSLIGGGLGIAIGALILDAAPALIPQGLLPATVTLAFDLRVVAFCAAAALAVGVLFGLAPAWQATSISTASAMGEDTRTTTGGGGRLRSLLVIGEVATAVLLLFGAGLLLRTLIAVESFDRGYRAGSVLTMLVDPLGSSYPTPEKLQQFFDQVEAEVRTVPGVQDAAWSSALPLGDSLYGDFALTYEIVGDPPVPEAQRPTTNYQVVSPTYFSTLDLPIVAGRAFDSRDTRDSPRVCIVNEAFVRTLGGRSPIGMRVAFTVAGSPQSKPNARRDCRGGEAGQGPAGRAEGLRPDLRADGPRSHRRHAAHGAVEDRQRRRPDAGGAGRDFADRQGAAGQRPRRRHARGCRVGVDRAAPVPGSDGHGLRDARGRAGDGRCVRHPCVFRPAAGSRFRPAPRARRDDGRRAAACRVERASRRDNRRGHRLDPRCDPRSTDRLGVVRRAAAGLRHVRRGDAAGGTGRGVVDRRSGLASDADRSGGGAAEQIGINGFIPRATPPSDRSATHGGREGTRRAARRR